VVKNNKLSLTRRKVMKGGINNNNDVSYVLSNINDSEFYEDCCNCITQILAQNTKGIEIDELKKAVNSTVKNKNPKYTYYKLMFDYDVINGKTFTDNQNTGKKFQIFQNNINIDVSSPYNHPDIKKCYLIVVNNAM
jgi:hypothetical protein